MIGARGQLPYKEMIGGLAVMGFGPDASRRWSFWEYRAVIDEWNAAHAAPEEAEKPPAPDISELHRARQEWAANGWGNA